MKNTICISALLFFLFNAVELMAGDTLTIKGTRYVNAENPLNLQAGQTVLFESGATLVIQQGLKVEGKANAPVVFTSANSDQPGLGLVISGQSAGELQLAHLEFSHLVQPLRFDPFWSRAAVNITQVSFHHCQSDEPVVYVGAPFSDLQRENPIQFQLKQVNFFNNRGNILVESVGASHIQYDFSDVLFSDNQLAAGVDNMGVLHLDCVNPVKAENLKMNRLAFNRNQSGERQGGISTAGAEDDLYAMAIYQNDPSAQIHYDRNRNFRIPRLNIQSSYGLADWSGPNPLIGNITHRPGEVSFDYKGNIELTALLDSNRQILLYSSEKGPDQIMAKYQGASAQYAVFSSGLELMLPPIELPATPLEPILEEEDAGDGDDEESVVDSTEFAVNVKAFPKDEGFMNSYEVGIWYGAGIYGGNDIKWKYFPIPATLEWSMGVFGEKAFAPRWTARASYYYTRISAHNIFAPGFLSGSRSPEAIGNQNETVTVTENAFDVNFLTKIHMLEASVWWHPERLSLDVFNRRLSSSFGGGLGFFHFTPYRVKYLDSANYELYNLRKLGTEGQNYLPGRKPYSSVAMNLSLGVQLRYALSDKFTLRAEGKLVGTTTDYLDDMSNGNWYGGNYEQFVEAAVENSGYTEREVRRIVPYNPDIAPYSPRTQNAMTDYFFQLHLGLSYRL